MDQLFKIKDSVLGYISPAANRRRNMMQFTPVPASRRVGPSRPLPGTLSEPKDVKTRGVVTGRVNKKYLSPGDTGKDRLSKGKKASPSDDDAYNSELEDDEDDDEDNGDEVEAGEESEEEVLHDTPTKPTTSFRSSPPRAKPSKGVVNYKSDSKTKSVGDHDLDEEESALEEADEEKLASEQKVAAYLTYQEAMDQNKVMFQEIRDEKWHPSEIALFEKMAMRGFEPLMDSSWYHTFRTCPPVLFTEIEDDTFINTVSGNEFRATNALESLTTLGGRVRALTQVKKSPEFLMKKEIENYIRWSEKDAGYINNSFIPLIVVLAGNSKRDPDLQHAADTAIALMSSLAARHRESLLLPKPHHTNEVGELEMYRRAPPVVFGVITLGTQAVILSLDSAITDGRDPKTITTFDFKDHFMDVWNGIAIAILCITVRNMVIEQLDEMSDVGEHEIADVDA